MDTNIHKPKLIWKDEYSVKVEEIDKQHQNLFAIINDLIHVIDSMPNEETVKAIIKKIVDYKVAHFATEEKYFHLFNFEGTTEHETAHQKFNTNITELQNKYQGDVMSFAFALVDFLEDWLIEHLMHMDQKYTKCFNEHGLR